MFHPDVMRLLVDERIETLRAAARHGGTAPHAVAPDRRQVELRLCRVSDDPALDALAALEGRPTPTGRFVLALVEGRLVAALPLAGGTMLADPFAPTADLRRLLEVRAAQLREPAHRGWLRRGSGERRRLPQAL